MEERQLVNMLDSMKYSIQGIRTLLDQRDNIKANLEETNNEISNLNAKLTFMEQSKACYVKAVDILYQESIGALKETLNTALKYIMFDKNYACNLILDDKRGTKTIEITLIDLDEDFEVDLKDGVGQGVRTIISFILKAYYLINRNSKYLFLDEKYSALSDHYIPRFFEFMKRLADDKGMILVLITHDTRFAEYADRTYLVNDGHASLMEEERDEQKASKD